ncbi:MAG TPA: hydroxyethylthiazole kinase [Eubacteriaceae bacterium]|jgi:hydroxyethylthiazole kinase|nr:hydroxyethylthiazole kinase [Eubacteriaceae bacterium]
MSYNGDFIGKIREKNPIVHNITNYVTANDCANILLGIGASPIMADEENEVEKIVSIADALVINIGTLNQRTVESMVKAGTMANKVGIPVVLDPVGCGASDLRKRTTLNLLEKVDFSVVRGNISEIKSAFNVKNHGSKGVDANEFDCSEIEEICLMADDFANQIEAVVAITGSIDVVSDGKETFIIKNGTKKMSRITGTGCMLSSLTGAFIAVNKASAETVSAVVAAMGLAGELGYSQGMGMGSYRVSLMDNISLMDDAVLREGNKIERFK